MDFLFGQSEGEICIEKEESISPSVIFVEARDKMEKISGRSGGVKWGY